MGVDLSGIGAVQARIAEIQAKFSGFGSPVQPGTYSADGALNGRTAWNYKLQDLIGRDYNNTKFPWSGVNVEMGPTTGGNGLGGTFTSGNTRVGGATTTSRAALAGGLATAAGVTGAAVVDSAKKYLGVPYVWGGTTAAGLDCSGLVQKAYGDLGISLPRVAADQAKMGTAVPSLAQARPGDLLAFGSPVDHIAIYVGNNQMIAAPQPGEKVKIQSVYATPVAIRRVVPDGPDLSSAARIGSAAFTAGLTGATGPAGSALAQAPAQFRALFQQAEARYGVPATLLAAVAKQESGFNPGVVSPAGAIGLMQIMPGTAAGLKVNPRDPAQAVDGAARLLRDNLRTFGSTQLALAAYNAGPGAVKRYGGVPPYAETQNYVRRIMADRGVTV
ncbi:NlpC/P60 family protein [Austwickia chelonae]|uniref:NlpC/P60 domain-containing protein n=1 Tax=Austwickia chelonae NBRC 105200 TaxID=1184607 RepID=K6VLZ1_9MICO|nr:transglycosylase SLT domain-containing protein [Austwickia chelonae]GAB77754.1 hypothetical protein AUCHE_06_00260 [Austwickia chelonae NBRC 105200]SEV88863.1 NlpC/P60 family protein [Austwickia chelonae]